MRDENTNINSSNSLRFRVVLDEDGSNKGDRSFGGVFEIMSKERAIEQVTKSLDEALKRAEDNQGRELHDEIVHIINNIKEKYENVTND